MNGLFQGLNAPPGDSMGADAREFDELAQNLISGKGYQLWEQPTSFRAPGFPLFLAGIYKLFGVNYFAARVAFSLIGAMTVVILFLAARRFTSEPWALLCAFLLALYPHHAYYSIHFLSEPLYTLLLLSATWCLLYPADKLCIGRTILAGVLFGMTALIRPLVLLLMPMIAIWAVLHYRKRWRLAAVSVLIIAAVQILTMAPWAMRNHRVHGTFMSMTTNGGSTFWGSNNERVLAEKALHGGWISTSELPGKEELVSSLPTEIARDKKEWELGFQFLRTHPGSIPRLLMYKFLRFWNPWLGTPNTLLNLVVLVSYGALLPFMIIGWVYTFKALVRGSSREWLLNFHVFATLIGVFIFWGAARFRVPLVPFLLIYAVLGLQQVLRWAEAAMPSIHGYSKFTTKFSIQEQDLEQCSPEG